MTERIADVNGGEEPSVTLASDNEVSHVLFIEMMFGLHMPIVLLPCKF